MKECTASVQTFFHHLQERFKAASQTTGVDPWPVKEEHVLAALLSLRCRGVKLRDSIRHLSRSCEALAGPGPADDAFPKTVQYQQHCQGLCINSRGQKAVQMQQRIVTALNDFARSAYKTPNDMIQDDLLLQFSVHFGRTVIQEYFFVTGVAFRGGVQKPMQSYIKLAKTQDSRLETRLSLLAAPHVTSFRKWPQPIVRACCGSLESFSTVQLAAHLLCIGDDSLSKENLPRKIVVERVDYEDESRCVVKLTGLVESWNPIVISNTPAAAVVTEAPPSSTTAAAGSTSRRVVPGSSQSHNASGGIDMLDIFSEEHQMPALTSALEPKPLPLPGPEEYTGKSIKTHLDELQNDLICQMMEALDLTPDGQGTQDDASRVPKFVRDYEGLLDHQQLEAFGSLCRTE